MQQRGHGVEALRVARHQQPQRGLGAKGAVLRLAQRLQPERLLALAAAGQHHHAPPAQCRAPAPPALDLRRVGFEVELEVAQHLHRFGPKLAQARRVGLGLGQHGA